MKIPFLNIQITRDKKMEDASRAKPNVLAKPLLITPSGKRQAGRMYEYDYKSVEINAAVSVDPLLARGVSKYVELIMSNGIQLVGDNQKTLAYVRKRLEEIFFASDTSLEDMIRRISYDLIVYGNTFIVLSRNAANTSGKPYTYDSPTKLQPISAMFLADPRTMKIMRNTNGQVLKYQQDLNQESAAIQTVKYMTYETMPQIGYSAPYNSKQPNVRTFNPADVVHFAYNKDDLSAYGRSFLWEVLDDLSILRDLEYVAYEMVKNKVVSIGVYTVGTQDAPATQGEIEAVRNELNISPDDPLIVLPERHNFKLQTVTSLPDITNYINHFKQKVYSALGLPSIAFAEGGTSNRATADVQMKAAFDRVRELQNIIADKFNTEIISQILRDGGYKYPIDESNAVKMHFADPDVDMKIKKENQAVFLYEHNAITFDELRQMLGLKPLTEEEKQHLHLYEITEPTAMFAAEAKAGMFGGDEPSAETSNLVQPENQHEKKLSATSMRIQP